MTKCTAQPTSARASRNWFARYRRYEKCSGSSPRLAAHGRRIVLAEGALEDRVELRGADALAVGGGDLVDAVPVPNGMMNFLNTTIGALLVTWNFVPMFGFEF